MGSLSYRLKLLALGGAVMGVVAVWLSQSAMPNSPELYDLRRLQEKIFLALAIDAPAKAGYWQTLLDNRLKELEYVVQNREDAPI